MPGRNGNQAPLSAREAYAVGRFVERVRGQVPADLAYAVLFGSKARGTARPDSDVDLLLVFRELPPDREPQATLAERIAEQVSAEEGVPVEPWSVSLIDLQCGFRTPMLVDALDDGLLVWPAGTLLPRPPFTPRDALRCASALLDRVEEGSDEVADARARGDFAAADRRARDDVVRMCTAALLLHGETRPRRAEAVRRFLEEFVDDGRFPERFGPQLRWAEGSFGPDGDDDDAPVGPPPGGPGAAAELIDQLRDEVAAARDALGWRLEAGGTPRMRAPKAAWPGGGGAIVDRDVPVSRRR